MSTIPKTIVIASGDGLNLLENASYAGVCRSVQSPRLVIPERNVDVGSSEAQLLAAMQLLVKDDAVDRAVEREAFTKVGDQKTIRIAHPARERRSQSRRRCVYLPGADVMAAITRWSGRQRGSEFDEFVRPRAET